MSNFDSLLPHCTVRLIGIVDNQPVSTGTGFYYFFNDTFTDDNGNLNPNGTSDIGIVTNRHVVEGMEEVVFFFNSTIDGQEQYVKDSLRIKINQDTVIYHPDGEVDLCVLLGHELISKLRENKRKFHMHPIRKSTRIDENKLKDMPTIQNLVMVGYPIIKAAHLSTTEHTEEIKTEEMLHIGIAIKAKEIDVFDRLIQEHYRV